MVVVVVVLGNGVSVFVYGDGIFDGDGVDGSGVDGSGVDGSGVDGSGGEFLLFVVVIVNCAAFIPLFPFVVDIVWLQCITLINNDVIGIFCWLLRVKNARCEKLKKGGRIIYLIFFI